MQEKTLTGG